MFMLVTVDNRCLLMFDAGDFWNGHNRTSSGKNILYAGKITDGGWPCFIMVLDIERQSDIDGHEECPVSKVEVKMPSELITAKELAKRLNVQVSWIYRRTRLGQEAIPHVKMGKYVRFDWEEVVGFLKQ